MYIHIYIYIILIFQNKYSRSSSREAEGQREANVFGKRERVGWWGFNSMCKLFDRDSEAIDSKGWNQRGSVSTYTLKKKKKNPEYAAGGFVVRVATLEYVHGLQSQIRVSMADGKPIDSFSNLSLRIEYGRCMKYITIVA